MSVLDRHNGHDAQLYKEAENIISKFMEDEGPEADSTEITLKAYLEVQTILYEEYRCVFLNDNGISNLKFVPKRCLLLSRQPPRSWNIPVHSRSPSTARCRC